MHRSCLSNKGCPRDMWETIVFSLIVARYPLRRPCTLLNANSHWRQMWVRVVRSLLGVKPPVRRSRTRRYRTLRWLDMAAFDKEWYLSLWVRFARSLLVAWGRRPLLAALGWPCGQPGRREPWIA